jgi:hypothetical protein
MLISGACYEEGDGVIRLMLAAPPEDADAA